MIIIKITGGLGNQLFQYSFGKYLSLKFNTELKFDVKTVFNSKNFTNRLIGITDFNVEITLASDNEVKSCKNFNRGYLARIERKLNQKFPLINRNYIVEYPTMKIINELKQNTNYYFDGYWQSYKYLSSIKIILQNEITLKHTYPNKIFIDWLKKIENSQSISIHIRRGDYISIKKNFEHYGICSKKYYENAIHYISSNCTNPIFYIFSDDLKWSKENFIGRQFIFITGNQPSEDMYLMSKCKHNIIANSTFSWWAAWLNQNIEKIVIAPKTWFKESINESTINLIPKAWIRI